VQVRILFTFTGGNGHFLPAVPLARAARARGHEVAFSCQEAMLNSVLAAGFPALGSGGRTLAAPEERRPLLPVDRTREENVVRDSFAGSIARERAVRLMTVTAKWRPDVVIHDEMDFGAAVAAEVVGIPHVSIIVLAAGGLIRPDLVAEPLDHLRAEHGLPPDPHLTMLRRHLTLVPVPPSFRTPADPLPATARHIQPAALEPHPTLTDRDEPTARTLNWLAAFPNRPTVYFTLGTVFHQESGDLFPRILEGLVDLDANIVVTVGREIDPGELGNQPANVHIERFIPQGILLRHCNTMISHAGSGSVIGALAFGVPLVLLPLGADQPLNADRCEALGVARVLDPITADSDNVHETVIAVLHGHAYRNVARQLEEEISRLPTAADAVTWIETIRV
jgi:UDP:flavonoid glycosyltransferase YjiC (YdhE family)